jgi:ATP-binding cassette, subfamily F, member 3
MNTKETIHNVKLKAEKEELLKRQIRVKEQQIARMEKGLQRMSGPGLLKVKQIHRIEKAKEQLPEMPREIKSFTIRLPEPSRVGELPIRAMNISKSYGDLSVIDDLSFTMYRNERVALIGSNGSGKSTLIKLLLKRLEPDEGEIIHDSALKVGYYSQEFETFNFKNTVIDTFMGHTSQNEGFSRAFLGRFMFPGEKVFQKIETLSGGEKTRLAIAMLTGKDNNMLVLDEPTTYLDVLSQRIILESLKQYQGTMLIVSHTPEFLKELEPKRALLMPEQKVVPWSEELLDRIDEI